LSPTARSLAWLRKEGFIAAVVERWLPRLEVRKDVFGFGDILAANPVHRIVMLVQATSVKNVAARLAKARSIPQLAAWLRAGGAFEVHGWECRGGRWLVRRVGVNAEDLEPVPLSPRAGRRPRRNQRLLFDL
jgi:hypothetical protein